MGQNPLLLSLIWTLTVPKLIKRETRKSHLLSLNFSFPFPMGPGILTPPPAHKIKQDTRWSPRFCHPPPPSHAIFPGKSHSLPSVWLLKLYLQCCPLSWALDPYLRLLIGHLYQDVPSHIEPHIQNRKTHPDYPAVHHSSRIPLSILQTHCAEIPKPAKEPGFTVRNSCTVAACSMTAPVRLLGAGRDSGGWVVKWQHLKLPGIKCKPL